MSKTLIVAHYNEDTGWTKDVGDWEVKILSKAEKGDLPNVGREPHTFLTYIISNYENLPDEMVFVQGHPFDHYRLLTKRLKENEFPEDFELLADQYYDCEHDGAPQHAGLPVEQVCSNLGLRSAFPLHFGRGGQFYIKKEKVLTWSKGWYEDAMEVLLDHHLAPWCFERLWELIYE